ncbi:MAG: exodeoxyribonuclease VII small subunit [Planctomycetes bacterium]|nr:exodeoxyribonuclease VII small subunit [Planctomycetota bacterium]
MGLPRTDAPAKKERFEDFLAQVEEAVRQLEGGNLALEDSLTQYESGVKALKRCYEILEAAEKRVQILLKTEEGGVEAQPLDLRKSEEVEREDRARRKVERGPASTAGTADLPF